MTDIEEHHAKSALTTETVQSATLSLESVHNIERGDRLALGVLCVCDRVPNDALQESLQNTSSLLIDHWKAAR